MQVVYWANREDSFSKWPPEVESQMVELQQIFSSIRGLYYMPILIRIELQTKFEALYKLKHAFCIVVGSRWFCAKSFSETSGSENYIELQNYVKKLLVILNGRGEDYFIFGW